MMHPTRNWGDSKKSSNINWFSPSIRSFLGRVQTGDQRFDVFEVRILGELHFKLVLHSDISRPDEGLQIGNQVLQLQIGLVIVKGNDRNPVLELEAVAVSGLSK